MVKKLKKTQAKLPSHRRNRHAFLVILLAIITLCVYFGIYLGVRHRNETKRFQAIHETIEGLSQAIDNEFSGVSNIGYKKYCERAHVKFEHADLYCTASTRLSITADSIETAKNIAEKIDSVLLASGFNKTASDAAYVIDRPGYWSWHQTYQLALAKISCGAVYTYVREPGHAVSSLGEVAGTLGFLIDCSAKATRAHYSN